MTVVTPPHRATLKAGGVELEIEEELLGNLPETLAHGVA
jgi:hypothetical protein